MISSTPGSSIVIDTKVLICERTSSMQGFILGNLFLSRSAYLVEGALDTWVNERGIKVRVG